MAQVLTNLRCPCCGRALAECGSGLACGGAAAHVFPVINGVPVLINDTNSVFSTAELADQKPTFFQPTRDGLLTRIARRLLPADGTNVAAARNFSVVRDALLERSANPVVLVVGGSVDGVGMATLTAGDRVTLVVSDVAWGARVQVLCDVHDLPFEDGMFDGVIMQAVLEHVIDPVRAVSELVRVLNPAGIVYAETPFMQQVHGGKYDFTRFTFLGHRRLFRQFEEIGSGLCCGPGMALSWAWQYFWTSFATGRTSRRALTFFSRWTSFYFKYADPFLATRPRALDAASGYYFIGKKSAHTLTDRELLSLYARVEGG